MSEKLHIEGQEISIKTVNDQDYLSLTDMSNWDNAEFARDRIRNWLRLKSTLEFCGIWERYNNNNFNYVEFDSFLSKAGSNSFILTPKRYIHKTNAVGIISKPGRSGGTFAHVDIAFEFGSWLNPEFKYRLISEFKRLRSAEIQRQRLEWNAGRELARLNYPIQTAAIKEVSQSLPDKKRKGAYASEADLINFLVFEMTAKEWRAKHPDAKGNLRDSASTDQNVLIANLESFNSQLIRKGANMEARERALADMLEFQAHILNQKYLPE